jgi:hypothetical protein
LLCHDVIEKWRGAKWSAVCSFEAWWRYCISVISSNIGPWWLSPYWMWHSRCCPRVAWQPWKPRFLYVLYIIEDTVPSSEALTYDQVICHKFREDFLHCYIPNYTESLPRRQLWS